MSQTKKIILISSPSTTYEIERQTSIYSPDDHIYMTTEGVTFSRTEEQSQARINELEVTVHDLRIKLDKILDIVYPDRYKEEE
jgi:hypothetical protein